MDKAALRAQFLRRREVLRPNELQDLSLRLAERVLGYLEQHPKQVLHVFLPRVGKKEVNTWLLVERLRAQRPAVQLVVPRVVPGTFELEHYRLTPEVPLLTSRWGIPEPDPLRAERILPSGLDLVLVPLLAFDEEGYRLGYGGGFYDRFLPLCRPEVPTIGLSLFGPVASIPDRHAYDQRLDACFTPEADWYWT